MNGLSNRFLVNLGAEYSEQLLTLILKDSTKGLAKEIEGKTISVTGKPEIVVTDARQIQIDPPLAQVA